MQRYARVLVFQHSRIEPRALRKQGGIGALTRGQLHQPAGEPGGHGGRARMEAFDVTDHFFEPQGHGRRDRPLPISYMNIAEAGCKPAREGACFGRLFPRSFDNFYRGYWPGAWIFGLVVAGRLAMGVNGTFNTEFVAVSADGIPLSTYPSAAAQTVVALFALTALLNLTLGVLGGLALIRYRAMIPLLFLLYLCRASARASFSLSIRFCARALPPRAPAAPSCWGFWR